MMDMKIVRSLADHIAGLGWSTDKLLDHMMAAECGDIQAIATAIDKGITLEELCEGFRMAIVETMKAR
jgi:hypothetical protein